MTPPSIPTQPGPWWAGDPADPELREVGLSWPDQILGFWSSDNVDSVWISVDSVDDWLEPVTPPAEVAILRDLANTLVEIGCIVATGSGLEADRATEMLRVPAIRAELVQRVRHLELMERRQRTPADAPPADAPDGLAFWRDAIARVRSVLDFVEPVLGMVEPLLNTPAAPPADDPLRPFVEPPSFEDFIVRAMRLERPIMVETLEEAVMEAYGRPLTRDERVTVAETFKRQGWTVVKQGQKHTWCPPSSCSGC